MLELVGRFVPNGKVSINLFLAKFATTYNEINGVHPNYAHFDTVKA